MKYLSFLLLLVSQIIHAQPETHQIFDAKGKKGSPTKYTLLSPSKCGVQIEVNNKYGYKIEPQSEPYIEPQSEPQSEDIISKGKVEEKRLK